MSSQNAFSCKQEMTLCEEYKACNSMWIFNSKYFVQKKKYLSAATEVNLGRIQITNRL